MRKTLTLGTALLWLLTSASPSAIAEETALPAYHLEAVKVTSDKQGQQDLQKVSTSISAMDANQIEDAHIEQIEDAARLIPNLNFVEFGASFEQKYFIRGLGSTHNDPAVSFNIDGVTQTRLESSDLPLFDIENIEVLRGPQGTLYGRNSLGGVININTKKPANITEAKLSAELGTYDLQRYQAAINLPLLEDKLFMNLSGIYNYRDGYIRNDYLNKDVDHRERSGGRLRFLWLPGENSEIDVILNASKNSYGGTALQPISDVRNNPHKANFNHDSLDSKQIFSGTVKAEVTLEKGVITSITAAQDMTMKSDSDYDFSILDAMTFEHKSDNLQFSEELRYAHGHEGDAFRWLAGLYGWYAEQDDTSKIINQPDSVLWGMTPGDSNKKRFDYNGHGAAAFGQATLTLFEQLDFTLGLRAEYERKEADVKDGDYLSGSYVHNFSVNDSNDFTELLPKFTVAWRATGNLMPYATVARGYRSGGFNTMFDSNNKNSVSFDPEYSWNYEIGLKSDWFERRLTANLSAFYITIDDMQVNVGVPGQNLLMVDNAGKATSRGLELEVTAMPLRGLEIIGSYGYIDMSFDDFKDNTLGKDYSDKTPPYVPMQSYSLAVQYRRPINDGLNIFVRGELIGMGKQYWDHSNKVEESSYALFNAQIGLESDALAVYLWGKNLTDKEYVKTGYETGNGAVYAIPGDPFTIGLNATYKF